MAIPIDQQIRILSRRCDRIITEQDLARKLETSAKTGKPMRIKFGMDPTAPDVTLGHAVPLKVIRQFQDWGHQAVLIIGDYTARVGDPSGVNTTRPVLSGEQIDANAKTYIAQVGKILRTEPESLEVRFNGQWLGTMNLLDIIRLASRKSVAQVLAREDFAKRYADGVDIRLHEILYPLLQGWDSVQIRADVEMGGSDQLFNNLVGREFQKEEGQDPQVVFVTPLLVGTDGQIKMSKSKGNYISVTEAPQEMFGKVMRVPDALLESYFKLLTDLPEDQYRPLIVTDPRHAKSRLAQMMVEWLHGPAAAQEAAEYFQSVIVNKEAPQEMPELRIPPGPHKLPPLLVKAGMAASNSEGMRKIKEGAVRIDGQKVGDERQDHMFDKPAVLQLGNRRFVRLIPG
jgi:tyrosyl-tRNA synthetase